MPHIPYAVDRAIFMSVLEERKFATFRAALFADKAITDEQALWWENLAKERGTREALRMLADARRFQQSAYLD